MEGAAVFDMTDHIGRMVVLRLLMLVVVVVCYRRMVSREIPSLN